MNLADCLKAAAKTGSIDTVIALVEAGINDKSYIKNAMNVCKKRTDIYNYLSNI